MDKRDVCLQQQMPTIMMPRYAALEPSAQPGERLVVAANGVFLEVTRKWARFVRQVANSIGTSVPYGECKESTDWNIGPLPVHLLRQFDALACQNKDVEIGASIIWNEATGYRLAEVQTLSASGGHLKCVPPPLASNEQLIIDCHSHAHYPAMFSDTDDKDDKWDVKLAYVVGNCNTDRQSHAMRLCVKGIFKNTKLEMV